MRSTLLLLLAGCAPFPGQTMECVKWVACSDALPGATKGSQDATFGPDGVCWQGSDRSAQECTQSCKDAVEQRGSQPGAPAECK
ncbi:MAG: hypothetical protein JNK82_08190 [Myxococcaceae bacterium]|nr:hypothetical protein [Myxococcaceae bacterium]